MLCTFESKERKQWRKDHPPGFYIKPVAKPDGSSDIFHWKGGIPGKAGTDWEGGDYKIVLKFTEDYPMQPPQVSFDPPIFHPNVYNSGKVCLSIIGDECVQTVSRGVAFGISYGRGTSRLALNNIKVYGLGLFHWA
mmetsp:Transcript_1187/g.1820  ORF Transcript_1187/g.1820 Transcript_1187/m.1820 type:complete len:136 (+) Transcript_1187:2347-2754(+)